MEKLLFLLIFIPGLVFANDSTKGLSIGLTGGISIPTGDFKETSGGGADTGKNFGIQVVSKFQNNVSLGFSVKSHVFEYSDEFQDMMANSIQGVSYEFEKWEILMFLASPRYSFPITKKFKNFLIFIEAHIGYAICKSPEVNATIDELTVRLLSSGKSSSLTLGAGGGAHYFVNDKLSIELSAGVFPYLEPEFEIQYSDGSNRKIEQEQKHNVVNICFSYHF